MATAFHLRWILVVAGIAVAAFFLFRLLSSSSRQDPTSRWQLPELPPQALSVLCMSFLALALGAKYSQLHSMQLNGQDFWLFVDMLDQMSRGGFMLTRFAPQTIGWVQHGVVHPYFSFTLLLPLTWMIGPLHTCLWFGPLSIAGAGALLGLLARPRWGNTPAVLITAAFLTSSLVGRIVMYDVHPEALYPFATFAWAWAAGWGDGKLRPKRLLLATALLMGIKTDSFLVFFPLLALEGWRSETKPQRLWRPAGLDDDGRAIQSRGKLEQWKLGTAPLGGSSRDHSTRGGRPQRATLGRALICPADLGRNPHRKRRPTWAHCGAWTVSSFKTLPFSPPICTLGRLELGVLVDCFAIAGDLLPA